MATVETSIQINAPREHVFEVFTDLENAPDRIEGIKSLEVLTDGPLAPGTRFRETRVMFGREATETMEFTELSPPTSYVVDASSHGSDYRSVYTFSDEAGGTRVDMTFTATPQSFMAKLFTKLMGRKMMKMAEKCFVDDMTDLKRFCEKDVPPPPDAERLTPNA